MKKKNSNRQIGDRPKTRKTFRIDSDLIEQIEIRAESLGISQVEIVEKALKLYLQQCQS